MRLRSPETLRALMHQSGLSTRELATAAQCHNSFIDHLLHGRRDSCASPLATKLAEAVDVPVSVLFAEEADKMVRSGN
ncbi:helix-turn-helix domain-containing protein [Nocardia miyunensis]|uniref:helix-turn-helix domain-containing protein n=1 Tax=Nocardia miyunensis TaxID=282684 RepID=UPI0008340398